DLAAQQRPGAVHQHARGRAEQPGTERDQQHFRGRLHGPIPALARAARAAKGSGRSNPYRRSSRRSTPSTYYTVAGGPMIPRRFIRAWSTASLAVTSAFSRTKSARASWTAGSGKVYFSISLQATHQSA